MQLRGNPSRMATWSVSIQQLVTVASISNVKCPLHASKTSIPCVPRSTPGLLFHSTSNQSFISSLVMQQPLGWHLTMIPPGSCSLHNSKMHFFITPCLNHHRLWCPASSTVWRDGILEYNGVSSALPIRLKSKCSLSEGQIHVTEKKQASPQSPLAMSGKAKICYEERPHSSASYARINLCWHWNNAMWCVFQQVPMFYILLSHI